MKSGTQVFLTDKYNPKGAIRESEDNLQQFNTKQSR